MPCPRRRLHYRGTVASDKRSMWIWRFSSTARVSFTFTALYIVDVIILGSCQTTIYHHFLHSRLNGHLTAWITAWIKIQNSFANNDYLVHTRFFSPNLNFITLAWRMYAKQSRSISHAFFYVLDDIVRRMSSVIFQRRIRDFLQTYLWVAL